MRGKEEVGVMDAVTLPGGPRPAGGSAEAALLRCLARLRLDEGDQAELRGLLTGRVRWEEFLNLSARHRLLPLCSQNLTQHAADRVPPSVLRTLHDAALLSARRSLQLTAELLAILRVLEAADVPAIAYKGPVLALQIYGSIALRDVLDLDILVEKRQALRARRLLHEYGYRDAVPAAGKPALRVLATGCNFPLVQESTGAVVELHWTPEPAITERHLGPLWRRLASIPLAGVRVRTFEHADLLPLLCMHGCRHMWERLEWVTGVAEILRAGDVPWSDVLERATALGGRRALLVGVVLANELLNAPVSERVLRLAQADRRVPRLVKEAREQLFRDVPVLAHRLGVPFHSFQLRTLDGLRERLRYVGRRIHAQPWQSGRGGDPAGLLLRLVSVPVPESSR